MKKNIYIPIIAVALGLSLSSCDKFLDEVPDALNSTLQKKCKSS